MSDYAQANCPARQRARPLAGNGAPSEILLRLPLRREPRGAARRLVGVTETIDFRFVGGPFTYVYRNLPTDHTDGITDIAASMDGASLPQGKNAGEVEVSSGNPIQVTWHFTPTSDATRRFVLTYRDLFFLTARLDTFERPIFLVRLLMSARGLPVSKDEIKLQSLTENAAPSPNFERSRRAVSTLLTN
jgi:hypothetical protein